MLIWKHKQVGRVYDFYFDGLKEERDGGDNPHQNRWNRNLPLAELVGQLAEQRRGHGQCNRLNGGEHTCQRVVAVVMLHGNGDGHAHHRERHAGNHRTDGITSGMRYAQQLRIPTKNFVTHFLDASHNGVRVGQVVGHNSTTLLSAPDWMFPADVALPAKPSSNDVLSMVAQSLRWISLFAYLRHGYSNRWLGRDTR